MFLLHVNTFQIHMCNSAVLRTKKKVLQQLEELIKSGRIISLGQKLLNFLSVTRYTAYTGCHCDQNTIVCM